MRWMLASMMLWAVLPGAASAQDARAALMEADRVFDRATAARGIEGWVEFAADDAVFMPDGVDFVRGKEAVKKQKDGSWKAAVDVGNTTPAAGR